VSQADALDYVLGVTCGNDVSARKWQQNDVQWWRAKGADTFGPCGPFIVSGLDYDNLDMELRVNGKTMHKTNTSKMIHGVAPTVSFLSRYVTLQPGDLIFTGTAGKTQPLAVGDVVEVEIEGVGVLRNRVVAEK
jgi:2-keto-4-pentenoate hydratase/2-oxohepta-3-ene-1,7-dioic acid hydratase in catechol pathway